VGWQVAVILNILVLFCSAMKRRQGAAMADDMQIKREIVLEADAETLERMRKEGHARGFTVYCDEGERIGGDNTAPPPLAYFGLSVGF
jgi:hypothetical protein